MITRLAKVKLAETDIIYCKWNIYMYTGCKSLFWKICIWIRNLEGTDACALTMPQKKAWVFSCKMTPWKLFLSHSHFQDVKLKLNIRTFFWGIICFSTSIGSFQILNSKIFRNMLLHPVQRQTKVFTYCKLLDLLWFIIQKRVSNSEYKWIVPLVVSK